MTASRVQRRIGAKRFACAFDFGTLSTYILVKKREKASQPK
jgi:hypothetical protein